MFFYGKSTGSIFHSSKFGLEFCLATNELGVFLRGSFWVTHFLLGGGFVLNQRIIKSVFCVAFSTILLLTGCSDISSSVSNQEVTVPETTIVTSTQTDDESNYFIGDTFVGTDNGFFFADGKNLYYKNKLDNNKTIIHKDGYFRELLSDGTTVFYCEVMDTAMEKLYNPEPIYKAGADESAPEKLFSSNGLPRFITYYDSSIYYVDELSDYERKLMRYDTITKEVSEFCSEQPESLILNKSFRLGERIYLFYYSDKFYNDLKIKEYDLISGTLKDTVDIGTPISGVDVTDSIIAFCSYRQNENEMEKNRFVYCINSDGNISKSIEIPDKVSVEAISADGTYIIGFNRLESDNMDLYKVDLATGKTIVTEKGASHYKNKNYIVEHDLLNPSQIYFGYNMGLYDAETNTIAAKQCEGFKIDIYKQIFVSDGYLIDSDFNCYPITDLADTTKPADNQEYYSDVMQMTDDTVYYCSNEDVPAILNMPVLDFSDVKPNYIKLSDQDGKAISSFVICNKKIYYFCHYGKETDYNTQAQFYGDIYECDLSGKNHKLLISDVTNAHFMVENDIIYYAAGNAQTPKMAYSIEDNSSTLSAKEWTRDNSEYLFAHKKGDSEYNELDGGYYYVEWISPAQEIDGVLSNELYYRKDEDTGEEVVIGHSFSQIH